MSYLFSINELSDISSILRIRGSDAYTYLQGQCTADLNQPAGSTCYGLWLNQRGKVVADSFILRRGDNDFIAASFSTGAAILRGRLESYIVADEVDLADETKEWCWLRMWGAGATALLETVAGSSLPAGGFVDNRFGLAFSGRVSSVESFEWLALRAAVGTLVDKLTAAGAQRADADFAERERIVSAIPAVPADIGPNDLPNEGGLEDTAISHTKGCYLGQEVMARLKNLGQVRRRLHVVRGTGAPPSPHTALFQGGRKIGETRSAAPDGDGFVAMAMLNLLNLDPAAGLATELGGTAEIQLLRRV